jgi:hypothetical protein
MLPHVAARRRHGSAQDSFALSRLVVPYSMKVPIAAPAIA